MVLSGQLESTSMSPSTAIERLSDAALRRLLDNCDRPVSEQDKRRRALEFAVEEDWANGFISSGAILEALEEETEAGQFLVGALLRDRRVA
jgi:hypothetical protein